MSLLAAPVAYLGLPEVQLPAPFPDHHQTAETLLFLFSFAVLLPLAVAFIPPVADRIAAGPNGRVLPGINALAWASLLGAVLAVKVSERMPWGGGLTVLLVAMLLWWLIAGVVIGIALRSRSEVFVDALVGASGVLWWAAAALLLGVGLAFAFLGSVSIGILVAALAAAGAAVVAYRRIRLPGCGRWGLAFDAGVALLVFLAVPNLVILRPEIPSAAFETEILHFHQDFFLGPASHVIGGGTMLVDTLSQYGVASIDFIAGWLTLTGVGNGMLGLLDGLLDGLVFAGAYFVIRAAGVRRPLAAAGMAFAVMVLALGLVYPIGGLLQHGAIRFGMPMGLLVAAVAGLRFPRTAGAARIATLFFLGLSSIWALEAFAYTAVTFAAIIAVQVPLLAAGERRRWLLRQLGLAVIVCVGAHLVFAFATLMVSGHLPDWGLYLSTLRAFLTGKIGDLTYDFSPWSPGLALGPVCLASAAGTALLVLRHRDFAARERTALVALAGSTAYGVALFSYLVNRSSDHIVPYVSLPVVVAVLIWLGLLLRTPRASMRLRCVALGLVLAAAALMASVAWSSAEPRFEQTALAHVLPGGESAATAIDRLRDMPPISAGASEAERLLDRWWPDGNEALVIVEPDLGVEALAATGKINALPLSDPWEDSFVDEQRLPDVDDALDQIRDRDLMLLDGNAVEKFRAFRQNPEIDPLEPDPDETIVPSGLATLQKYALARIGEDFRLEMVERGTGGLVVARLVPR